MKMVLLLLLLLLLLLGGHWQSVGGRDGEHVGAVDEGEGRHGYASRMLIVERIEAHMRWMHVRVRGWWHRLLKMLLLLLLLMMMMMIMDWRFHRRNVTAWWRLLLTASVE